MWRMIKWRLIQPHLRGVIQAQWRLIQPQWRLIQPQWRFVQPQWSFILRKLRLFQPQWRLRQPQWHRNRLMCCRTALMSSGASGADHRRSGGGDVMSSRGRAGEIIGSMGGTMRGPRPQWRLMF